MRRKLTLLLLALTVFALTTEAKGRLEKRMFIYGFASSFKDSTVYFTDVMEVGNVWVEDKNGFVLNRADYSLQLRDYLSGMGKADMVALVVFDNNEKKIQKKYARLKKRYAENKKKRYNVETIGKQSFSFKTVDTEMTEMKMKDKQNKTAKKTKKNDEGK